MAVYSKADLVKAVLLKLGTLDPHEAPEAEDAESVLLTAQTVLEELYDEGIVPFDLDGEEIPAPFLTALAFLVALPLVSEYGVSAEREARIEKGADRGYRTLRRLKASPYYGIPQRADFF